MSDSTDRSANTGDRGSNSGTSGKKVTPKKQRTAKDPAAKTQLRKKTKINEKDTAVKTRTKNGGNSVVVFKGCNFISGKNAKIARKSLKKKTRDITAQNVADNGSAMKLRAKKTKTKVSRKQTVTKEHARQNQLPKDNEVRNPSNVLHESSNPAESENPYQAGEINDKLSTSSVVKNDSKCNAKAGEAGSKRKYKGGAKQEGPHMESKEKIPKIQTSTIKDFKEYTKQGVEMDVKSSTSSAVENDSESGAGIKRKIKEGSRKETKGEKKKIQISTLGDFNKYAEQDEVKRPFHRSTKPHVLLRTAEIEAYRGNWKEAKEALQNALKYFKKHSHPPAAQLQMFAKKCKSKAPLRATLFYFLSATQRKAVSIEDSSCYASQTLAQAGRLLKSMLSAPTRPDMRNGVHYKDVAAKFSAPLMVRMYGSECSKGSPDDKAYALSWIAEAQCDIKDYKKATKYGQRGLDIIRKQFPLEEERNKRRDYAGLLQSVGVAYEKLKDHSDNDALKYLEEAVLATESTDYGKNEYFRKKPLSIREGLVESLKKKIADNTKCEYREGK